MRKKSFSGRIVIIIGIGLLLSQCQQNIHKVRVERFQMNTLFQVVVYAKDQRQAKQWAEKALDVVSHLEEKYSIHRTNSLLFSLNREGKGTLDDDLLVVWKEVEKLFTLSEGLFDPTIEPLMRLWGFYHNGNPRIPSEREIRTTLDNIGFSAIKRNTTNIFLHNRRLDFGGILKGYALDKAAEYLKTKPINGFLINAGGNIVVWGTKPNKIKWQIAIRHPRKVNDIIALFSLDKGSVATSGDYEQYFIENGKRYHHILNPFTGYPISNGVASVTVVTETGIESDGFSTLFFLIGKEKGIALANKLKIGVCYIMDDLSLWTNQFFPELSGMP